MVHAQMGRFIDQTPNDQIFLQKHLKKHLIKSNLLFENRVTNTITYPGSNYIIQRVDAGNTFRTTKGKEPRTFAIVGKFFEV